MKKIKMPGAKPFSFMSTPKGSTKLKFGKGLGVKPPSVRVRG